MLNLRSSLLPAVTLATAALLPAQTPPSTADDMIVLSPFNVSGAATTRYQATEATSGTRVTVSLLDSTQSVSVVTRELIDDIGAGRLLDAAKYVSGVYESSVPNAQDRTTIRGFQNDGATVDGFSYFSFANLDPAIIDRVEVVKGPNAIMAPQGVPGGTVNAVSKKPFFSDKGFVSGQVGRYSATRAEVDVNRVVSTGKLAVRVVGAVQDADDYGDDNFHKSTVAMPMFTYRFGPSTELTVQAQFSNWTAMNYGGLPVSLYADSTNDADVTNVVPRDFTIQSEDITRHQSAQHYRAFFTTTFSNAFSMRVAANYINSSATSKQINIGAAANQVVVVDPASGLWKWNGVRNDNPLFTATRTDNFQDRTYANFQNDFVYKFETPRLKSTTVAGYAINYAETSDEINLNYTASTPQPLASLNNATYTPTVVNGWNTRTFRDQQIYAYEVLSLFNDSLLISGGLSRNWYYSGNKDILRSLRAENSPSVTLPSGGIVYKPAENISLYYGYSEQSTAINPSTTSANVLQTQTSKQNEVGIRAQLFDKRLYATVAYFDIKQDNFSIPNPANNTVPPPSPLLPALYLNRKAHGAELELTFAVTKNLTLIGNGTVMRNRDPDEVPIRGTAEKSAALWVNYAFEKGTALGGLSIGAGVDYLDKRPGDNGGGLTSASTPANPIRIQPSFWLPERTLVNANIAYRVNEHWKAQVNIDNLFDEDYLIGGTGRQSVYPGVPFNARLTVTYSF